MTQARPMWIRRRKGGLAALAVGALVATPTLAMSPAMAAPDGDDVVINEVYTRGGSANEPFDHKFVELYNPTDEKVELDGMSLLYRSQTNSGDNKVNLDGTIPAEGFYLIEGGQNSGGEGGPHGEELPEADLSSGSINPAGNDGIVALVDTTDQVNLPEGDVTEADDDDAEQLIDLVGYGEAVTYETEAADSPPATGSISRDDAADTDDNSEDVSGLDDPTPTNADGDSPEPPEEPECPGEDEAVSIADIQGEGEETPYDGCEVTTDGVVTAVYPVGGFDGAYIQTPGTGGDIDPEEHTASDGIFVYGSQFADAVEIGDYLQVTGEATEYYGLTQLTYPTWEDEWEGKEDDVDVVEPAAIEWPATDEERERFEGMLIAPQGDYTVTDLHESLQYGQIGLARGSEPLRQPTEFARPESDEANEIEADNEARRVDLDDGSSWNYMNFDEDYHETPIPYLSLSDPVRVGAEVNFEDPVILDYRNDTWKFQPTSQAVGDLEAYDKEEGEIFSPVTFDNTRSDAPVVDGDLTIGAFNVLNYFTDLGEDEEGCEPYRDREGNPTTGDFCEVRGAFDEDSLKRQTAKIVSAITELDADVLALQEVENTRHFPNGQNAPEGVNERDAALATLVDELNDVAGDGAWDYAPSPEEYPEDDDVIRNAFIYQTEAAAPVGGSDILMGAEEFYNAREPLAQEFALLDEDGEIDEDAETALLVTTHLKSKGSGEGENADQGDGQGASNPDRIEQARAMATYIEDRAAEVGTDNAFILGDLNSHTMEDPMVELYDSGYTDVGRELTDQSTYSFDGLVGSLDHVMGNEAGMELVTEASVWNVNAYESDGLEYSRYNYNIVDLYDESPARSSDHDPMLVGLQLAQDDEPSPEPSEPGPTDGPSEPGEPGPSEPGPSEPQPPESGGGGEMPSTGVSTGVLLAAAAMLMAGGGALALRRRGVQP